MRRTKAELAAIVRDEGNCRRCGCRIYGSSVPFSVHHRLPRSRGTKAEIDVIENLVLVCGTGTSPHCHAWIHQHPTEAYRTGWTLHRGEQDPAEIPLRDTWGRHFWLTEDGGAIYADATVPRLHL